MSTSLDPETIKVIHEEGPEVESGIFDNCDPHDLGGLDAGRDDFNWWDC